MNYKETVDYLYSRLPMFTRDGARAFKKDLHNIQTLCTAFENPHLKFRSIHVAGTNGKGSTSHMLAAILQANGYKTGLYTSPHIKDFRERIRVNGQMASEEFVIKFAKRSKEYIESIEPSFFELTVAMAFEYFAQQNVDVAVIETGLGGRLDSTNIITPDVSVITNIGYDHMNILGKTLDKIAYQKAGIIKPGVPVVIGEYLPETKPVFEQEAREKGSEILFASDLYEVGKVRMEDGILKCKVTDLEEIITEDFELDLPGMYQTKNLCTVLATEKILLEQGYRIDIEKEKFALANVKKLTGLRGRWDIVRRNPDLILDVGHNEDGIKYIMQQLQQQYPDAQKHFVLGFVKDKDVEAALELFPKNAEYYFTNAHMPRAMRAAELKQIANSKGFEGNVFDDVNNAVHSALNAASATDVVIVCGSFFTIAELNQDFFG